MDIEMKELMLQLRQVGDTLLREILNADKLAEIENEEERAKGFSDHLQKVLIIIGQISDYEANVTALKETYETPRELNTILNVCTECDGTIDSHQASTDDTNNVQQHLKAVAQERAHSVTPVPSENSDGLCDQPQQQLAIDEDCDTSDLPDVRSVEFNIDDIEADGLLNNDLVNDEQTEPIGMDASQTDVLENNMPITTTDCTSGEEAQENANEIANNSAKMDDTTIPSDNAAIDIGMSFADDHAYYEQNKILLQNFKPQTREAQFIMGELPSKNRRNHATDHLVDFSNTPILNTGVAYNVAQSGFGSATEQDHKPNNVAVQQKRKSCRPKKTLPHLEEYLKRKRYDSVDTRSHLTPMSNSEALKKRQSATRKTICCRPPLIENEDEVSTVHKNTNQNAHVANDLWTKLCKYCGMKIRSVSHYGNEHPEHEVPVARPPPEFALLMRKQAKTKNIARSFTFKAKKMISGQCSICGRQKTSSKYDWIAHILNHTGEKKYSCSECNTAFDVLGGHSKQCSGTPINFSLTSSENGINVFMCNDCNYLQMNHANVMKHMKNEHGYIFPEEKIHYGKFLITPFQR